VTSAESLGSILARAAPRVLGALARRHPDFGACEDAVQEAMLAATLQWPRDATPDDPAAWLITVASRRMTDAQRTTSAAQRRENELAAQAAREESGPELGIDDPQDDSLELLFLCCHPAISSPSRIALTLRAVGGMSTAQIARAFLVPETTMAQRISRAKQRIRDAGATFGLIGDRERAARTREVSHVLYLVFNEGYTASEGPNLRRDDLASEAIRLTRMLHKHVPGDGEVAGLLSLMLLSDARRPARTRPDGALVPLLEQNRSLWNHAAITEAIALLSGSLANAPVGPFQVQAAIAAVHGEAEDPDATDWPQIVALYTLLLRLAPNPMTSLNHAAAVAMVDGPARGLEMLDDLAHDHHLKNHHRLHAVRAHLLEQTGDLTTARASYAEAARRTRSLPERRYLQQRLRALDS
jgi:RNA polymerase sigma factor (sigma-70 family)